MKIRDLLEKLATMDPDLDLYGYTEDEQFLTDDARFVLFDIDDIELVEAEPQRLDDGTPYLKFHGGRNSKLIVTLDLTSQF